MSFAILLSIFVMSNDAYMFVDLHFEWNYERSNFDSVCDFHKFVSVFHRIMEW